MTRITEYERRQIQQALAYEPPPKKRLGRPPKSELEHRIVKISGEYERYLVESAMAAARERK